MLQASGWPSLCHFVFEDEQGIGVGDLIYQMTMTRD